MFFFFFFFFYGNGGHGPNFRCPFEVGPGHKKSVSDQKWQFLEPSMYGIINHYG